jgi:hypothetical protein
MPSGNCSCVLCRPLTRLSAAASRQRNSRYICEDEMPVKNRRRSP